jgi:thiamine pyrophosphokinase
MDGSPVSSSETDCLIVANGEFPGVRLLRRLARAASLVIATDGAADRLLALRLEPDRVIGDFDSADPAVLHRFLPEQRIHVPDQNRCDLEKALDYAVHLQCRDVTVAGALGKRLDHALTTVSLLVRYAPLVRLRLVDHDAELIPVVDRLEVRATAGDVLSLIALAPVHGVTLTGVRWPLNDFTLEPGSRGVSNVVVSPKVSIAVRDGCLLVCHLRSTARQRAGSSNPERK